MLTAALMLGTVFSSQLAANMEKSIAESIDAGMPAMVELLERLVKINSGTMNHAGVKRVAQALRPEFEALGFRVRWIPMNEVQRSGHLVAERTGTRGKKVLIVGHMDTVFEPSSPFQEWVRNGDRASGPGVIDMKGGLVVLLGALKAMHRHGALDDTSITVFLTGDEESVGEPLSISRRDLVEAGKRSDVALEYEAGVRVDDREFASVGRRSSSVWTLRVKAKEGHSLGIFSRDSGNGAIYEMSRILTAFHDQLQEHGATFNAGIVLGGGQADFNEGKFTGSVSAKSNIIAPVAVASGDLRTLTDEQTHRIREKMMGIVQRNLPGTSAEIRFEDKYPAMASTQGNKSLLKLLNEVSHDLKLKPLEALDPIRRGAGDISFVAPFVSSLSGLGAYGEGGHAPGETVHLPGIAVQAKRSALLIYRLTR